MLPPARDGTRAGPPQAILTVPVTAVRVCGSPLLTPTFERSQVVRKGIRAWLIGAVCAALVPAACTKVENCNVSPVEIEELREDISVIDKDLAGVHERRQSLEADLAAKQADLDSKKDKPAELRRKLDLLKRGSGRIEKKPADTKKSAAGGAKKESS